MIEKYLLKFEYDNWVHMPNISKYDILNLESLDGKCIRIWKYNRTKKCIRFAYRLSNDERLMYHECIYTTQNLHKILNLMLMLNDITKLNIDIITITLEIYMNSLELNSAYKFLQLLNEFLQKYENYDEIFCKEFEEFLRWIKNYIELE